ncbi:hypothetical protein CJ030_MR5G000455 [Morella rubra]|uniref:Uncharacterized protein n=1 Tax=Morella rubra TaxID=262757 RepID=A0A6A1VN61_9ROSI|nr:hypothetical protein CJ030_MR5G000455 [Morella rubra]
MDTASKASSTLCEDVPKFLSSFVDAFVDFSVSGGLFLPDDPCPPDCGDSSDDRPPRWRLCGLGIPRHRTVWSRSAISTGTSRSPSRRSDSPI